MLCRLLSPALDRSGRPSALKIATLLLLLAPAVWLLWRSVTGDLGAEPFKEVIYSTGLWALRLLFLSLAVTPLRRLLHWPKLILVRRMIGVAAALYASVHLLAYAGTQAFDLAQVASEIALRIYLTIGFLALLGLWVLAATSSDAMLRHLGGRRWRRLHRLVYPIGLLATVHFFLQSKLDVSEATVMAGLYLWLMAHRLLYARFGETNGLPLWSVAALGLASALVTVAGEALYFGLATGVDPWRILRANLSFASLRPGWSVLLITGLVTLAALRRRDSRATARLRPATVG